jgi:hypothetical protein
MSDRPDRLLVRGFGLRQLSHFFRSAIFTGFNISTGSIDLTAHAAVILATATPIFIGFRVLMSARGNALLKLSKPVQDNLDLPNGRRAG